MYRVDVAGYGATEMSMYRTCLCADALCQPNRIRIGLDTQFSRQHGLTGLIGLQRLPTLASRKVRSHLAAISHLIQRVQGNPVGGSLRGAGKLTARKLDFRQPVEDQTQAAMPDFSLDSNPIIKTRCVAQ